MLGRCFICNSTEHIVANCPHNNFKPEAGDD